MPMIELPQKLYDNTKENDKLDEQGYNSVSELTRSLIRRWNQQ